MIEDVNYLINNCERDSISFYIDSKDRNRNFFPYPAEYTIDFPMPLKNVVGFDILDATIPTTMYNVESDKSTIAMSTIFIENLAIQSELLYFKELANSKIFSNIFENTLNTAMIMANYDVVEDEPLFDNLEKIDNLYIVKDTNFLIKRFTKNTNRLQSFKNENDKSFFYFTYNINELYGIPLDETDIISIIQDDNFYLSKNNDNSYTFIYYEFYIISSSLFNQIRDDPLNKLLFTIYNHYITIEVGNYDISTLRQELNIVLNPKGIFVETTTIVEKKQGKLKIAAANRSIVFNAKKCGIATILGFDSIPLAIENNLYDTCRVRENNLIYISNQIEAISGRSVIYAPGMVNLLGERYIILRCKEIEDHLLGSYGYLSYSPGLGLFKLSNPNDLTNLRFDFVSLVRKPFHPIGKITKLTFRFEMSSGNTLYDFKGINHSMLFMFKFLVPTQKVDFNKYILNPNYDPDMRKYYAKNQTIQNKEESDNEQDFDELEYHKIYQQNIEKNDYSSSGDDETDSDDSEIKINIPLSRRR